MSPTSCLENYTRVIGKNKYLVKPVYGWVVHGNPKHGWVLHSLIRVPSPWYFMCKCIGLYVDYMVVVSLLFLLFICWL